jgi:Protein of unknown function (DUF2637)
MGRDSRSTGHAAAHDEPATEGWLLRTGLSLSVWTLAAIATILAASGQVEFARWAGIRDVRAYAVPAVMELVAVAFLLIGYRRARRGDSASALWLLAAVVGAFAVYTNVAHSGERAGLVFGTASALALILWFVKLRDDYRQFQRHTGQATRPRPKLGALWLVAPRLATRAWVIAARRRISTVDEAVAYAEIWRAVFEDSRTAHVGRRLARRTAWRSVAEAAGGIWAELPRTAELATVNVVGRTGTPNVDGAASEGVTTRPVQPALRGPSAPRRRTWCARNRCVIGSSACSTTSPTPTTCPSPTDRTTQPSSEDLPTGWRSPHLRSYHMFGSGGLTRSRFRV